MQSLPFHGHWYCSGPRLEAIESFSHLKDTCIKSEISNYFYLWGSKRRRTFAVSKVKHPSSLLSRCNSSKERAQKGWGNGGCCALCSAWYFPTWREGSLGDFFSMVLSALLFWMSVILPCICPSHSKAEGQQHELLGGCLWSLGHLMGDILWSLKAKYH